MLIDILMLSLRRTALILLPMVTLTLGTGYVFGRATSAEQDGSIQGSIRVDTEDHSSLAKIDAEEAKERALAALRAATADDIELEVHDGFLVYEVEMELENGTLELELLVDAGDGKVLALDTEDDDEDP